VVDLARDYGRKEEQKKMIREPKLQSLIVTRKSNFQRRPARGCAELRCKMGPNQEAIGPGIDLKKEIGMTTSQTEEDIVATRRGEGRMSVDIGEGNPQRMTNMMIANVGGHAHALGLLERTVKRNHDTERDHPSVDDQYLPNR